MGECPGKDGCETNSMCKGEKKEELHDISRISAGVLLASSLIGRRSKACGVPPPRTPTSNGTNKPKVPLVDFWA